jgi:hypothetical protein
MTPKFEKAHNPSQDWMSGGKDIEAIAAGLRSFSRERLS